MENSIIKENKKVKKIYSIYKKLSFHTELGLNN